jgi:hypothetical protein
MKYLWTVSILAFAYFVCLFWCHKAAELKISNVLYYTAL